MKWFGESWSAPVCEPDQQVGTPWGLSCVRCGRTIELSDRGFVLPHGMAWAPYHRDCLHAALGVNVTLLGDVED